MHVLIEKWQSVHSDVTQERQRDRDGERVQWETQSRVQDLDLLHHDNVDAFTYTGCLWAQAPQRWNLATPSVFTAGQ